MLASIKQMKIREEDKIFIDQYIKFDIAKYLNLHSELKGHLEKLQELLNKRFQNIDIQLILH